MESKFKIIPLTKASWKEEVNISCNPVEQDDVLTGCGGDKGGCTYEPHRCTGVYVDVW